MPISDWKPVGHIVPLPEDAAKCPTQITKDRSEEMAVMIGMLNSFAFGIDAEYLAEAARQLDEQASHYDATAVLNRNWSREGSDLLNEQARCLRLLAQYIESNKKVTDLKNKLDRVNGLQKQFQEQFGI